MNDIEFKEKLQEIVSRIENEVLNTLSDAGDDWFAAKSRVLRGSNIIYRGSLS